MPYRSPTHRPPLPQRARTQYEAERGSACSRGYGRRWQAIRLAYLRKHPLCAECQRRGRVVPASDVDHIQPLRAGGTHASENLQALCHSCHSAKTAREQAR